VPVRNKSYTFWTSNLLIHIPPPYRRGKKIKDIGLQIPNKVLALEWDKENETVCILLVVEWFYNILIRMA
jgi:hypothetical protein